MAVIMANPMSQRVRSAITFFSNTSLPAKPNARREPYSQPTETVATFMICLMTRGQNRLSWTISPNLLSMLSTNLRAN
jgi:hypothetical protein